MDVKLRYFDARAETGRKAESDIRNAQISEFFRGRDLTGNLAPRVYFSNESVARRTAVMLSTKADSYFKQIDGFDPALRFTPFGLTRIIAGASHLGYAAITSGSYADPKGREIYWVFFFANFDCQFGNGETLFEGIPVNYGLTYFALALTLDDNRQVQGLDPSFRGNGLMFSTRNPHEAFNNIVKMKRLQHKAASTV